MTENDQGDGRNEGHKHGADYEKGSLTLTDLTGPTLEGTLSGTWASRRGAGDTAPVTSWERVELRDGHFKATFDGSQQGAQRWPGSE